ncbi:unnamed protein product [Lathyrus sativus]|nr:unnamed protein product [Lathyrus sativus]
MDTLCNKLSTIWKFIEKWGVTSFGKEFYEFSFSFIVDLQTVRASRAVNIAPGVLKLFTWTKDFNPSLQQQSTTQVWI